MHFSIAIPVFGQANFLPSALSSIKAQNSALQLAVMDATPDNSVQQVLDAYEPEVYYHRHGKDSGQTAAIQEGWDNTDGEILAWLCADDYYFPNILERVEKIFLTHPEIDVVYGNAVFVDENGQFLGYFPALDRDISVITQKCCICQPSCFIRRQAFERIGSLNTELHYIMDWDLWTRLYLSGAKFYYLDEYLSVVRMYQGTKTASRSRRRFFEIGRHLLKHTNIWYASKSFIHFYCYDFLGIRLFGLEHYIQHAFSYYRQHKLNQPNSTKVYHCLNFGFANLNHPVTAQVEVVFPWYQTCLPTAITIECSESSPPHINLNGLDLIPTTIRPAFNYQIPKVPQPCNLLNFKITTISGAFWQLKSLEIH